MNHQVIEEARRGNRRAFERLVGEVVDRLYGAAVLILHDRTAAEDAVQEALIRMWRDMPKLRDPERFDAWLHQLLVRACLHTAKRDRRPAMAIGDRVVADDGFNLEASVAQRDVVLRGLHQLSASERSVLVMRYYLDLSVPQIADALHVPVGTAKSRLHHAQRAMRAALDADGRALAIEGEPA
jgi:RNA polymerase sigma-70 factor (ECF subfamily)